MLLCLFFKMSQGIYGMLFGRCRYKRHFNYATPYKNFIAQYVFIYALSFREKGTTTHTIKYYIKMPGERKIIWILKKISSQVQYDNVYKLIFIFSWWKKYCQNSCSFDRQMALLVSECSSRSIARWMDSKRTNILKYIRS